MTRKIWGGLAIGAIIGGGLGDEDEVPSDGGEGLGGAKNSNNDSDSSDGGQGMFSLWGREIWLYLGGIVGFGDKFGPYVTTGPMIGKNPDWAIGGGIHFGKCFGLGVVIPIRQAMKSYAKNQDKVAVITDYVGSACNYVYDKAICLASGVHGGLEQLSDVPGITS